MLNQYTIALPSLRVVAINRNPILPIAPSQPTVTVREKTVERAIERAEKFIS